MIVGILKERSEKETRVATSPAAIKRLLKLGYEVQFEIGCGEQANFSDATLAAAGANGVDSETLLQTSDIVFCFYPPLESELASMKRRVDSNWLSCSRARNESLLKELAEKQITALSMDSVPRISRAQKMDALSSMANIAGYRAIVEAASVFGGIFTGQITAAGKMPPAKVLVIGAGVAGLSAIGTANGLGAIVRAFDTRLAVKEQVASMGADFLELEFEESGEGEGGYAKVMSDEFLQKEMELFADQAKEVDIIVTTALIPGKPAPKLITQEMVESMRDGSVIVDMAAEQGGNCELTVPHERVVRSGVTIVGYTDLPGRLPTQASRLYGNNLVNLLEDMTKEKDGIAAIDLEDQVIRGSLVTHEANVMWPPPPIEPSPVVTKKAPETESQSAADKGT